MTLHRPPVAKYFFMEFMEPIRFSRMALKAYWVWFCRADVSLIGASLSQLNGWRDDTKLLEMLRHATHANWVAYSLGDIFVFVML